MKIAVIGDVHLGGGYNWGTNHPALHINTRLIDFTDTLITTIDEIVEAGVTHLVFTGDIFEHRRPSLVEQKAFSRALAHAISAGIEEIYIVIGNHDQQRQAHTTTISYLKELNLPNIRVFDNMDMVMLEQNGEPALNLILMPFRDRNWFSAVYAQDGVERMRHSLDFLIKSIENDRPTIVVGHMAIQGTVIDDRYVDMRTENQLFLPTDMFSRVDLTIMGHIHEPGVVSDNPYIAYVGSMEKTSSFEQHDKVYCIVDTNGSISYHPEPCRPIYEIEIDFTNVPLGEDLMAKIKEKVSTFAEQHRLSGSIVRVGLRICAEDDKYCDGKAIKQMLKDSHKVFNCLDITPTLLSTRQARDERITERVSTLEALTLFLNNTVDDDQLREELIVAGANIIKTVGDS